MDKKVSEEFDDYEDKKKTASRVLKRDSQDDEDDTELLDPMLANSNLNATLKEISAPYEIPHYPIELEEHRKIVQQHLTDMTLNNIGMNLFFLFFNYIIIII